MQHLRMAHSLWRARLMIGDVAVDATCGNGCDTAVLVATGAQVIACDIQQAAIDATRARVGEAAELHHACHTTLLKLIGDRPITVLVYNLGYLPGGDRALTTGVSTTIQSVESLLPLVARNGLISLMCYPGHPEGAREQAALLQWAAHLPAAWTVTHHRFSNRSIAPSLLVVEHTHAACKFASSA